MSSNFEKKMDEFQRVVLKRIAGIEAALEIMNNKMGRYDKKEYNRVTCEEKIQTITSLDELQSFEDRARGENMTGLENKCISLCGIGKGINIAYRLVDILFSRAFLTQCSWAGGSRGEGSKICFKMYQHTIMFFFNVIHRLDNSFTLHECNEFFKNVLRYSKQRNSAMRVRMSAPKRRSKEIQLVQTATQVSPSGDDCVLQNRNPEPPEIQIASI
jgi:hypothetical protein